MGVFILRLAAQDTLEHSRARHLATPGVAVANTFDLGAVYKNLCPDSVSFHRQSPVQFGG